MMNKIKKLHEGVIEKELDEFNNYSENTYTIDNSLIEIQAFECAEITKDVAIEFAKWISEGRYNANNYKDWTWYYNNGDILASTTEELFNIFIETHYEYKLERIL